MGHGIRVGLGLGVGMLATLACVTGSFGCSGAGGDPAAMPAADGVSAADAPPEPPPPAPPSPLPSMLQLDGGGAGAVPDDAAATAPSTDPGLRTMWALDGANRLVRFTSAMPEVTATVAVTGLLAGERLLGVDVRPADGKLYALGATSRLYVVDRDSGVAKIVGTKPFAPGLAGIAFGFTVDPVADKMRVQSDYDQNLALDPASGAAKSDAMLMFAAGDANQFQSPNLIASAFAVGVGPAPSATTLFALDSTRDLLTTIATPSDGQVTTIGALGVDITDVAGFHIWGGGAASKPLQAFAVLSTDGMTSGLYRIDLDSGAAALVGAIGAKSALRGLAIEP